MSRLRAATLAIGTELTDGQIFDRNSAIISKKIGGLGFDVIEHRAVPDDRILIAQALAEMTGNSARPLDVLFVTGGLGPTSDDFTRDVLAGFFRRDLEFDQDSWVQIEKRLHERGIAARDIQKQQCYFPQGSQILFNPAGTANGFMFNDEARTVRVIVLPGPPAEIEAIWQHSLQALLENLVPLEDKDELFIWQCLGRGESDIAELVEAIAEGSGLRLGYRVHLPYVEVKLWAPRAPGLRTIAEPVVRHVRAALKPWTVAEGDGDPAADFMRARGPGLRIVDAATQGLLAVRLLSVMNDKKILAPPGFEIRTLWKGGPANGRGDVRDPELDARNENGPTLILRADTEAQIWHVGWMGETAEWTTIEPALRFKVESERGRNFLVERALLWVNDLNS